MQENTASFVQQDYSTQGSRISHDNFRRGIGSFGPSGTAEM